MNTYTSYFNDYATKSKKQAGEEACYYLYKSYNCNIIDVRNEQEYQQADVDFIIYDGFNARYIEAKNDSVRRYSGNVIIETVSNTNKNIAGWGLTTKADYITIYQPNLNRILILDAKNLVMYLSNTDLSKFKKYTQTTTGKDGKAWYNSKAVLIKEQQLIDLKILIHIEDLTEKDVA